MILSSSNDNHVHCALLFPPKEFTFSSSFWDQISREMAGDPALMCSCFRWWLWCSSTFRASSSSSSTVHVTPSCATCGGPPCPAGRTPPPGPRTSPSTYTLLGSKSTLWPVVMTTRQWVVCPMEGIWGKPRRMEGHSMGGMRILREMGPSLRRRPSVMTRQAPHACDTSAQAAYGIYFGGVILGDISPDMSGLGQGQLNRKWLQWSQKGEYNACFPLNPKIYHWIN